MNNTDIIKELCEENRDLLPLFLSTFCEGAKPSQDKKEV